jgi:hypothetical protein
MSTARMVLVVLFLLVALGIVVRMDYEDAQRMARRRQEGIRLSYVSDCLPVNATLKSKRARAGHVARPRCRYPYRRFSRVCR